MSRSRMGARLGAAVFFVVLTLSAGIASAHVTVSSPDAEPGGFGKLVFRVPTESDDASTVSFSVELPAQTPFAFVSAKAKPGWKVTFDKKKYDEPVKVGRFNVSETVSNVTWTASASGIGPQQFDEFSLSVGPFPEALSDPLVFKAVQGYDDGTKVAWDQVSKGDEEPEHPAPTLVVSADTAAEQADQDETVVSQDETSDPTDLAARILGGVALIVALGSVALCSVVLGRRKNGSDV